MASLSLTFKSMMQNNSPNSSIIYVIFVGGNRDQIIFNLSFYIAGGNV